MPIVPSCVRVCAALRASLFATCRNHLHHAAFPLIRSATKSPSLPSASPVASPSAAPFAAPFAQPQWQPQPGKDKGRDWARLCAHLWSGASGTGPDAYRPMADSRWGGGGVDVWVADTGAMNVSRLLEYPVVVLTEEHMTATASGLSAQLLGALGDYVSRGAALR